MELNHKIDIDLLEFIKTGKFDYVKLGQTKEWILNNFPNPDDYGMGDSLESASEFLYGDIEFTFSISGQEELKEELISISCETEYKENLNGGEYLNITNHWIFEDCTKLNLSYVQSMLNIEKINYSTYFDENGCYIKTENNIKFYFWKGSEFNEECENINLYMLSSFYFII